MRIATVLMVLLTCGSSAAAQTPAATQGRSGGASAPLATPPACAALMKLQVPGVALTVTKTEWFAAGAPHRQRAAAAAASGVEAARVLPARRHDRSARRRRRHDLRHRLRAGAARELERPLPVPGRRRAERLGAAAARRAGQRRQSRPRARLRRRQHRHRPSGTGGFDASFMQDQQASLDFAYAAIGRVADVAKRIIAQHYGKPPDRSYFAGCSTGGREAMMMTQRYPRYFDGVVSGAPAMRTNFSGIGDRWVAVHAQRGRAEERAGPAGDARRALGERQEDGHRRLPQRLRRRRRRRRTAWSSTRKACRFDPKTLVCKGAKADGCLSMAQATALEKAFAGPKDSKGRQVYPGFLFDTGIAATQGIPGLLHGGSESGRAGVHRRSAMDVDRRGRRGAGRSGREPDARRRAGPTSTRSRAAAAS